MGFHPFRLEQFLSENEQGVDYNFSESGVDPVTLGELLGLDGHPRIGSALPEPYLRAGLGRVNESVGALLANTR